jgi:hypothetical protein
VYSVIKANHEDQLQLIKVEARTHNVPEVLDRAAELAARDLLTVNALRTCSKARTDALSEYSLMAIFSSTISSAKSSGLRGSLETMHAQKRKRLARWPWRRQRRRCPCLLVLWAGTWRASWVLHRS